MSKLNSIAKNILLVTIILLSVNFIFSQTEAEKAGKEIYEKYQKALGGTTNIEKVKTSETVFEIEKYGSKGKLTVIEDKANKKSYNLEEINGKKREIGSDGSRIWIRSDESYGYYNLPISVDNNLKRIKLPNEKIDGKEYLVIQVTVSDLPAETTEYYDSATFLLTYRISSETIINGQPTETKIQYANYQKVGDILVPFLEVTNNYWGTSTKKVLSVKQNIEVDSEIFELSPKKKDSPKSTAKISE